MTTSAATPLAIDLLLPAAWVDVSPISEDSGDGFRDTVTDLAALGIPAAVPSSIRLMLASLAAQSRDALMLSYFLDAATDEAGTGIEFLFASVAVLAYDVDEIVAVDELRAQVRQTGAGATLALVEDVKLGDLTTIRRSTVRSGEEGAGALLDVRYFVAVSDRPSIVVLCFATPNVEHERDFVALFDSIAGSLRITSAETA